jgi:hypothetical protein
MWWNLARPSTSYYVGEAPSWTKSLIAGYDKFSDPSFLYHHDAIMAPRKTKVS